jgi:hypothetical protein
VHLGGMFGGTVLGSEMVPQREWGPVYWFPGQCCAQPFYFCHGPSFLR